MAMKQARVASVRDLGPLRSTGAPDQENDLADILRRYPAVPEAERRQLLYFVKTASPPQLRETFLSRGLEGRLLAFRKAHAAQLRRGPAAWTPLLAALLAAATLLQMLA
jgi:hypothetical protein